MAEQRFADEQRLAFGQVAALYDRWRPSYPAAVIDAVLEFGALRPPGRVLEVGAGTGKATALLAERGLGVIALELSPDMAQMARMTCARYPEVEIVEIEFERWEPAGSEAVDGVISAAAWHWISSPAIDGAGGTLELPYVTYTCMATRS
jgi:trans-aconitate methyltransferase